METDKSYTRRDDNRKRDDKKPGTLNVVLFGRVLGTTHSKFEMTFSSRGYLAVEDFTPAPGVNLEACEHLWVDCITGTIQYNTKEGTRVSVDIADVIRDVPMMKVYKNIMDIVNGKIKPITGQ